MLFSLLSMVICAQLFWVTEQLCEVSSARSIRQLDKAFAKFDEFSSQRKTKILVVDGNNVRGMTRFEWNHVDLQERVQCFCGESHIDHSIIVWDHGKCPFAFAADPSMVLLFSGLTQRADDMIVNEVSRFLSSNDDLAVAVVTNDNGLNDRLRRKAEALPLVDDGESNQGLMFMDSTRFVDILKINDKTPSNNNRDLQSSIQATKNQIQQFCKTAGLGNNPRREKTWERAVLAESLRRSLVERRSSHDFEFSENPFMAGYIFDLEARGFDTVTTEETKVEQNQAFPGPSRLDKRQKRTLRRFNKMLQKGDLGN